MKLVNGKLAEESQADLEQRDIDASTPKLENNTTNITRNQLIDELDSRGLLDGLMLLLNSDPVLMFRWNSTTSLDIDNPFVIGAAQSLGIADMQDLFNAAAKR